MKTFIIPVDIYRKDVLFHYGTIDSLLHEVKNFDFTEKEINEIKEEITAFPNSYGYTISLDDGREIIFVDSSLYLRTSLLVIDHECYHAVEALYRSIGVYPNTSNEECYAYLHEYLLGRIIDQLGWQIVEKAKNS